MDDSIKQENIEEPPPKRQKVESKKKKRVIELTSSDNDKVYIDNNGYWKKWAAREYSKRTEFPHFISRSTNVLFQ